MLAAEAAGARQLLRLGLLRMAPSDADSPFDSQHPVDVAAALAAHDERSRVGVLVFSMPAGFAPGT